MRPLSHLYSCAHTKDGVGTVERVRSATRVGGKWVRERERGKREQLKRGEIFEFYLFIYV